MGDKTGIEWTEATWNPIVGCSLASPGCTNCYAMLQAARIVRMTPNSHYAGLTKDSKAGPVWTGEVRLAPSHIIDAPLRWRRPRRVFVNSMSDLFHANVTDRWIALVLGIMTEADQHEFQILTKRSDRMAKYLGKVPPRKNILVGVSVEDQKRADKRRDNLRALAKRGWRTFASYEPALGHVDWNGWDFLSWLISGGESGPNSRPSQPDWHRAARDFCTANAIPYFFKQWGGVSKKKAGCDLDGREWKQMPERAAA